MSDVAQDSLALKAVEGGSTALKLLLVQSSPCLRNIIGRRIHGDMRRTIDPEDILQQADIEVFRRISGFKGRSFDAFVRWRCAIALSRLRNEIRNHHAAKRCARNGTVPNQVRRSVEDSTISLLNLIPGKGQTPSRLIAREEAAELIQEAVDSLPVRCRQAVSLVHIEGQAVRDAATILKCSERAIHGLCRRALVMLGDHLERAGLIQDSRS